MASKSQFERLKTLLKEAEDGAERVIRVLRYPRNKAKAYKRIRLERELTYFAINAIACCMHTTLLFTCPSQVA